MEGHARDLMTRDVSRIEPDAPIRLAAERISSGHFGGLPVTRDGIVVGFLSEMDLMGALLRGLAPDTPVSEIMTEPALVVDEFAPVDDIMRALREQQVHHLPVVRGDHLVGIISPQDVIRHFAQSLSPRTPAA